MKDKPDTLTIAAYLDGRLDDDQCEGVERWLAASPEGVDLLLSARRALATPSPLAPDSLLQQAADLVQTAPESRPRVAQGQPWHMFYWPSAAALVLLSCLLGFQLAQFAVTGAAVTEAATDIHLTAEAVFDLGASSGGLPL